MLEAGSNLVWKQLLQLAQYIDQVRQPCSREQDIFEDRFDLLRDGIVNMESLLQTEKVKIDSEVARVGSLMQLQEAMLQEFRSGKTYPAIER
jgi:hypothetical protein